MKLTLNIRDHLEEHADHCDMLLIHASVDVDDLFDTNSIPEEAEIDLHKILAERNAIALIWDTDMLLSHYKHLTTEQAWEVLTEAEKHYTAESGLTWGDIAEIVAELHPEPVIRRWHGSIDVTIVGDCGKTGALNRIRDMAAKLSGNVPGVELHVDADAIYATEQ